MILPDFKIRELCQDFTWVRYPDVHHGEERTEPQTPLIEPFNEDQVEPASYDVRLGNDFLVFERDETLAVDLDNPADITKKVHIPDGGYFLLHPGEFVLGVTRETLHMPNGLVARIEGKSSIGRLGLMVHVTAGYIDPGFNGPVTLEMTGLHPLPIQLRPGKLIGQISFHMMLHPAEKPYQGRYQGAQGVEASKYGQVFGGERDGYGRLLCEDGSINTDAMARDKVRRDPKDGNTAVFARWDENPKDKVLVSDIFGGHEQHVMREEWLSWKLQQREDN